MKKNVCFIAMMLTLWSTVCLYAQNGNIVTGIVTDAEKNPIPGTSVYEKGTSNGVITDGQGNYKLKLQKAKESVLVFSFIGMEKKEYPYNGEKTLNVVLDNAVTELDEVVAIGYGSAKRKDLTGAVSSITGADP